MSDVTGTLTIVEADKVETMTWNGDLGDRAAARRAFEEAQATGMYFAFVETEPGRGQQVNTFDEVEAIERERGTVSATVQPSLAGG